MPTILVGCAWLGMSLATTLYISWLDGQHQEIMRENVTSIWTAAEMQHALWELQVAVVTSSRVTSPGDLSLGSPASIAEDFRSALSHARLAAITPEERQILAEIDEKFAQYWRELEQSRAAQTTPMSADKSAGLAAEISGLCDKLRLINQRLIEYRTTEHRKWGSRVGSARMILTVLGPLIGVWLGYRAANRLRRRLAAIHVTLKGAALDLGEVVVEPAASGNLDAIDEQVRHVADRLHNVLDELQGARQEVVRNERLAAVGQLAAGVAHEIRNPLTSVKLLVQTTARKAATEGFRPEQLAVVQDEIARMENTIQSLLDFAKPAASQRVPCELGETLRRAVNLVQGRAEQQQIVIKLPELRPLQVTCDPEQLHQVFVNLLLNGMDAMPDGGKLTIEIRRFGSPAAPTCEVSIVDEGSGIPAQLLDHVFEPFVSTKSRGTGLGLAISRRLVEEHGGRLSAANRAGSGAEFTVRLPCEAEVESEVEERSPA